MEQIEQPRFGVALAAVHDLGAVALASLLVTEREHADLPAPRVALVLEELTRSGASSSLDTYVGAHASNDGKAGNVPAVWQRIFDDLDLELVVVPKRDT